MLVATYGFENYTVVYVDALTGEPYAVREIEPPNRDKYRPDELKNISAIRVSDSNAKKTTTKPESINNVISILEDAKFFGFRQTVDVQKEGNGGLLINLLLKSGEEISLNYWTSENNPNLFDIDHQEWWIVEGFDRVLESLLPPKYLETEDIRKLAKEVYPNATFPQDEWAFRLIDKSEFESPGDQIWYAVGITSSQKRIGLCFHPVTGKVLRIVGPQSTDSAVKAVKKFYNLIAKGDYKNAWSLIHSRAQEPSQGSDSQEIRKTFNAYFENNQPKLDRIISAEWEPVWGKIPVCMCTLDYAVKVKIELENRKKELHSIKDSDGQWRLFWSYNGELK